MIWSACGALCMLALIFVCVAVCLTPNKRDWNKFTRAKPEPDSRCSITQFKNIHRKQS